MILEQGPSTASVKLNNSYVALKPMRVIEYYLTYCLDSVVQWVQTSNEVRTLNTSKPQW